MIGGNHYYFWINSGLENSHRTLFDSVRLLLCSIVDKPDINNRHSAGLIKAAANKNTSEPI